MQTCPDCQLALRGNEVECPNCARPLPEHEHAAGLPAPPPAPQRRLGDVEQVRPASHGPRLIALIGDSVIMLIIFSLLALVIASFDGLGAEGEFSFKVLLSLLVIYGGPLAVMSLFEASALRASPAKRVLGLRVVDASGMRITQSRALVRNVIKVLTLLLWPLALFPLFSRRRQGLHDLVAKTYVIEELRS